MAGLDVDTSSYPKAVVPPNPLDNYDKLIYAARGQQALQSGALTIDKQKLDLVNQRFGEMAKGFTGLVNDPDLNDDKFRTYVQNQVKLGYIPPEMAAQTLTMAPSANGPQGSLPLKQFLEQQLTHAQTMMEAVNFHYGQPGTITTNNAIQPVVTSPKFGMRSTGLPVQLGLPPTQQGVNANNNPAFAPGTPGAVAAPPPRNGLPVAQQPSQAPQVNSQPPNPQAPSQQPSFAPAPPINFEEGKKAYNADQDLATQKLTAVKPALLALNYIPDLRSGPGTKLWNDAVAGLKANGIISTDAKNDPTAIYQEVNKYLHQYLKGRGPRSDADLAMAEESSPNPNMQINPALLKLTQTAVAQDRIEAARARLFGGSNTDYNSLQDRNDYQNYNQYRSGFPSSMDERAFSVDTMTPTQKQDLAKEIQNMKPTEKARFMRSLRAFKLSGVGQ